MNSKESVGLCAALLDFIRSFAIPLSWHVQPGILRRHGVASPGRRLGALQGAPLAHRRSSEYDMFRVSAFSAFSDIG